jgi:alpha-L-rhamnosidase
MALAGQTNYPSWGNWIVRGATTLWETWSGTGKRDSLNHVMFGDVSAWFVQYLAGIRPGSPGYKSIIIKPEITGALTWAAGSHDSPFGMISTFWQMEGQTIRMDVTIPPNTTALIYLPTLGTTPANLAVREGGLNLWRNGKPEKTVSGVTFDHHEGRGLQTYAVWNVGSGHYQFTWQVSPGPK